MNPIRSSVERFQARSCFVRIYGFYIVSTASNAILYEDYSQTIQKEILSMEY